MPAVGSIFNIVAIFKNSSDELVNPDDITVELFDENGDLVTSETITTPTLVSVGRYTFSWEPSVEGTFTLIVTGIVSGDDDIVIEMDFVITTDNLDTTAPALDEDIEIVFSSGYDPLLVDPTYVQMYTSYGTAIEIAQLINKFSIEVKNIYSDPEEYPQIATDYIVAATLCSLTRANEGIASLNGGFTLGDFTVNAAKINRNTGYASVASWCELANLLKREMYSSLTTVRPFVRGSGIGNTVRERRLNVGGIRRPLTDTGRIDD